MMMMMMMMMTMMMINERLKDALHDAFFKKYYYMSFVRFGRVVGGGMKQRELRRRLTLWWEL